jgi:hypothetical protein
MGVCRRVFIAPATKTIRKAGIATAALMQDAKVVRWCICSAAEWATGDATLDGPLVVFMSCPREPFRYDDGVAGFDGIGEFRLEFVCLPLTVRIIRIRPSEPRSVNPPASDHLQDSRPALDRVGARRLDLARDEG